MPQASPPPLNPPCKAPSCDQTSYGVSIGHYFRMPGAAVQGVALWPKKKNPKYVQMAACTKQSIQGLSRYGLSPYLSKALITIQSWTVGESWGTPSNLSELKPSIPLFLPCWKTLLQLPGGVDVEGEAGREDQELPGDATGEESTSKCRIFVCVFFLMSMPCATLRTSFLSLVGNSALRRRSIILLMYSSVPFGKALSSDGCCCSIVFFLSFFKPLSG